MIWKAPHQVERPDFKRKDARSNEKVFEYFFAYAIAAMAGAVFYTGLGCALSLAGILFWMMFFRCRAGYEKTDIVS